MATQGPYSPGTVAQQDFATGYPDWSNVDNVKASDNTYATVSIGTIRQSDYMLCTNFGFTIPTGSLINGILVEIEAKTSDLWGIYLQYCGLRYNGSALGSYKSQLSPYVDLTDAYIVGGSVTDKWSATLTDTIINDSTFGVRFIAYSTSGITTVSVDHVRITVDYTEVTNKTLSDLVSSVTETISKTVSSFDTSIANNNQAYILNMKTKHWTFQDNAPFVNALYRPTTQKIIASRRDKGQIVEFTGTHFDTTDITSSIKTGFMNFGEIDEVKAMSPEASEAIKRLRAYFSEVIGEGNLTLTIYTELDTTGKTFTITVPTTDNTTLNVIRTALSRDIKGKYISMKITNASGNDFWIGESKIKVMPKAII